jgi:hypothetical protein
MESVSKGTKCFFFRNVNKSSFLKKIRFVWVPLVIAVCFEIHKTHICNVDKTHNF